MGKQFVAYTRVSTAKQGEGVSLQQQREAIEQYAQRHALKVARWFEERETAAKRGRRVFTELLTLLRKAAADGVLMHKIDRSARNLKDWADLGELIDRGVEVHFVNESLDLQSRGGRLSADIQAVVAADYIRNLREETRKGFYGRLKQGLYPLPAPIGYVDCGKGKIKEPDPVRAPLVRFAFERYATGEQTLDTLLQELHKRGLRNRRGTALSRNGLSRILNNPFYYGVIRLRRTGELYEGTHQPLISKALFDRVQAVLNGRAPIKGQMHDFSYRRLLICGRCRRLLTGELQKRHVYYRCHVAGCSTSVREETVDAAMLQPLDALRFSPAELALFDKGLKGLRVSWAEQRDKERHDLALRLAQLDDRLRRATDAYLDGILERDLFAERKAALLNERQEAREQLAALSEGGTLVPNHIARFFELLNDQYSCYQVALPAEKRRLAEIMTSNREVHGKTVALTLSQPFAIIANRATTTNGGPYRDTVRTAAMLLKQLATWFVQHPAWAVLTGIRLPDQNGASRVARERNADAA